MAGNKGCQDDFASCVLFVLNSILLVLTLLGLAGIIFVWLSQADVVEARNYELNVAIPEFILSTGIVVLLLVMSVALLGLIATAIQMRQNKLDREKTELNQMETEAEADSDDDDGKKKDVKKKGCCHMWGLGVYVFLCILAFFFLLAVAIVCGVYSDKMDNFNKLDTVKDKGDAWIDAFETKVATQVLKAADKFPITWNNTQAAMGCCGWNIENGNLTANTNAKCCHGNAVVSSATAIGKIKIDGTGCQLDGEKQVFTCEGVVAAHIKGNLVKASISTAALAFLQLALAICGCVVRYPQCFTYCNLCCKKKKSQNQVNPNPDEETPVEPINGGKRTTNENMI